MFKKLFKYPVTLQEKGLYGCLSPIAETMVNMVCSPGLGKELIPEAFVPILVHSPALRIPPFPKDYHRWSQSCKCPVIWVNYNMIQSSLNNNTTCVILTDLGRLNIQLRFKGNHNLFQNEDKEEAMYSYLALLQTRSLTVIYVGVGLLKDEFQFVRGA